MKILNNERYLSTLLLVFLLIFPVACTKAPVVSQKRLLMEMMDRNSITTLPVPAYTLKQFSSYDRRSVHPDSAGWFANADYTEFLGIDTAGGRREFIMFDDKGPGAIVRWWMTFAGPGSRDSYVRVYLDGNRLPAIEGKAIELLGDSLLCGYPLASSVSPLTEPERRAYNLYLPIPYQKSCRITVECDSIRITDGKKSPSIYYNINYRSYENGTKVVTYSEKELKYNRSLISDVNNMLPGNRSYSKPDNILLSSGLIEPGDSVFIIADDKDKAITSFSLLFKGIEDCQVLRSTVLSFSFDGHNTVWVPAGDFFGTGYSLVENRSWYNYSSGTGSFVSNWVMPFRKNCTLSVINMGSEAVEIEMTATPEYYKWTGNSLYFGAGWHEYHSFSTAGSEATGGTGKHTDLNINRIEGSGVWAGDGIVFFNTVDAWWGEGDEKIYVDGETFPSSFGTGTEDYYGYAWCRPEIFEHPFISQPLGSGNFHPGITINSRYRNLDAIPFAKSIKADLEMWHWLPAVVNSAHISYYYITPGSTTTLVHDKQGVQRRVALIK